MDDREESKRGHILFFFVIHLTPTCCSGLLLTIVVIHHSCCMDAALVKPSKECVRLLQALKDPNPQVRDSTAWTVGRVFEFLHTPKDKTIPQLVNKDNLPAVVQVSSGTSGMGAYW